MGHLAPRPELRVTDSRRLVEGPASWEQSKASGRSPPSREAGGGWEPCLGPGTAGRPAGASAAEGPSRDPLEGQMEDSSPEEACSLPGH